MKKFLLPNQKYYSKPSAPTISDFDKRKLAILSAVNVININTSFI